MARRVRDEVASVLALAQRVPEQEVVALPAKQPFPKALARAWPYVPIKLPEVGLPTINGCTLTGPKEAESPASGA